MHGSFVLTPHASCPCHDPAKASGWLNLTTMHSHIDIHLSGTLHGEVPAAWLNLHGRQRCAQCGLSVSKRVGVHPSCRPSARAAAASGHARDTPAAGAALPSFAEIYAAGTPTLRHVPAGLRHLWGQVLTRALAGVVYYNDGAAWQELLMLPQIVLCAPLRGGRKHQRVAAAFTLDRLQRWQEGERATLWASRPPSSQRPRRELRAVSLAREGLDRKACSALLSKGLRAEDAATVRALQHLHPSQPAPAVPEWHQLPPPPDLVSDVVAQAVRSFPAGTAPGPSQLRPQHLLEACAAYDRVAPFLGGASLVAVPKPNGAPRPIAIGETLRRLVGKCMMGTVKQETAQYLWPAQAGVAIPAGVESVVHTARAWVQRHAAAPQKVLLKLDFKNAFKTVSRQQVLDKCSAHFPSIGRWATWLYRAPSHLKFGTVTLQSAAGVQQGDPLGPLLFATALQPLASELRAMVDFAAFYLDDGILAGDVPSVAAAVVHTQQRVTSFGLELNMDKCELVAVGATAFDQVANHFPPALLHGPDGSPRVLHNFELLGAAVGHTDFVAAHTMERVQKATELLEALALVEDPQVGLRLLRSCAGHARLVHSMRCTPPLAQRTALVAFDTRLRRCFVSLIGLHLDASQWRQAIRGFGHAGLAFRSAAVDAPCAYIASTWGNATRCGELDAGFMPAALPASPDVQMALSLLQAHTAAPPSAAAALGKTQKQLTALLDTPSWEQHLTASPPILQALLRSEGLPGAYAFLTAVPFAKRRLEPASFAAELRHRLGVPETVEDTWCPKCDAVLDSRSLHAGVCAAGGERTLRHNAVRDVLATWCQRAGLQPEKEKRGLLLPQRPSDTGLTQRRPANIFLPCLQGSPSALDLAITGFQRTETLAEASAEGGSVAAAYAQVKRLHQDTAKVCAEQGVYFVPVVAEITGAWDATSARVLRTISRAAAAREGANPGLHHELLLQELCATMRAHRARAALRRRAEIHAHDSAAASAARLLVEES